MHQDLKELLTAGKTFKMMVYHREATVALRVKTQHHFRNAVKWPFVLTPGASVETYQKTKQQQQHNLNYKILLYGCCDSFESIWSQTNVSDALSFYPDLCSLKITQITQFMSVKLSFILKLFTECEPDLHTHKWTLVIVVFKFSQCRGNSSGRNNLLTSSIEQLFSGCRSYHTLILSRWSLPTLSFRTNSSCLLTSSDWKFMLRFSSTSLSCNITFNMCCCEHQQHFP